ncbi:RNA polymerase, sigma-24 subunit, ECF subfamily [Bacillus mycoides]|uniref:RNA polymerase, sigma-24 subunit, ECF subfamily n=1 Tax=Bacillus mycoides TaxID=1405 RepID=A0A1E8BM66_BACMY|nr:MULTISPECIES: sigma-70 family RNA polymerase sigma factor [Bacillus cereus group]EJV71783.1 sigma-70 family RNA polymerase sigma factor [Bacillus cereus BAG6O-2]MBJ8005368.1 sigma-70 family RNA polymerase sigma factor [Bacillus cereus]OFD58256.1 RNA polymerase, sigma-24 subunit, ECF subfamily [Bacillus mycoides]OFD64414.1 RNA polymerase, sigma-24 subunit, ECF subfamily [Bacillus mycoides]OFD92243.1 RNA polymerase, sigma-24 subunit, ECF subfamily [Bacillus mycoides]
MDEVELKEWLYKMESGDQEAFQVIYKLTSKDIYRTVVFLLGNQHQDVDDIVNEVYIKMWKSVTNYDMNRSFRFWLHGLVVKQVQDWRRKSWRRFRIFEKKKMYEQDRSYIMDEGILHKETRSELVEVVQKLSYKHREVVIMRYFHEYSLDEIAALLQIPVGTVKSRLHIALKRLRTEMEHMPAIREGEVNGF